MKKYLNPVFLFLCCSVLLQAQVNVLNAEKPSEIGVLSDEQKLDLSDKKFFRFIVIVTI